MVKSGIISVKRQNKLKVKEIIGLILSKHLPIHRSTSPIPGIDLITVSKRLFKRIRKLWNILYWKSINKANSLSSLL